MVRVLGARGEQLRAVHRQLRVARQQRAIRADDVGAVGAAAVRQPGMPNTVAMPAARGGPRSSARAPSSAPHPPPGRLRRTAPVSASSGKHDDVGAARAGLADRARARARFVASDRVHAICAAATSDVYRHVERRGRGPPVRARDLARSAAHAGLPEAAQDRVAGAAAAAGAAVARERSSVATSRRSGSSAACASGSPSGAKTRCARVPGRGQGPSGTVEAVGEHDVDAVAQRAGRVPEAAEVGHPLAQLVVRALDQQLAPAMRGQLLDPARPAVGADRGAARHAVDLEDPGDVVGSGSPQILS